MSSLSAMIPSNCRTQTSTTDSSVVDIYWTDGQKLSPQSGKLKGTLDIRDKVLVDQLTGLNTLASGLITQVNAIHRTGFGLNNVTNLDFFQGSNASDIAVNNSLDNASIATSSGVNQAGNNTIALQIAALKTFKGNERWYGNPERSV